MNKHKTTILLGLGTYRAKCTCGWASAEDKVRAISEFQAIAHKRTTRDFEPMKVVITDPEAPQLPFGCIQAKDLKKLAKVLDNLEIWHTSLKGDPRDHPCLRRIESADGAVAAHIAIGPAVGGAWVKLILSKNGDWEMGQEDANRMIEAIPTEEGL